MSDEETLETLEKIHIESSIEVEWITTHHVGLIRRSTGNRLRGMGQPYSTLPDSIKQSCAKCELWLDAEECAYLAGQGYLEYTNQEPDFIQNVDRDRLSVYRALRGEGFIVWKSSNSYLQERFSEESRVASNNLDGYFIFEPDSNFKKRSEKAPYAYVHTSHIYSNAESEIDKTNVHLASFLNQWPNLTIIIALVGGNRVQFLKYT